MAHRDADYEEQYRLPGVEPPQSPAVTFLAQRYDPLHLPPTLPVGDGTTEQVFNDVEEMVLADMPPVPLPNLAFPPAHAVVQHSYQNAGYSIKRWITAFLAATATVLCDGVRRVRGVTRHVVWQLTEAARGMVREKIPITRVTLDGC